MQNGGPATVSWLLEPPDGLCPLVPPHVLDGVEYGWRSADLGDVFAVDGRIEVCADIGFKNLDEV